MAELKKTAGYPTLIALSLTSMIGTGLFFGPAIAASYSGNASLIAWGILAVITVYVSLCFGELVSMFPQAGGVYEFAKHAYGRLMSFIVGWITWLVGTITTSVLIVAALEYVVPVHIAWYYRVFFAIALIIILNYVAYRGLEASSAVLILFSIITVGVIISILLFGAGKVNMANFTPFFTKPHYWIFISLFFLMETFFGWESATFLAEETKNPERVIPRSLLITTLIVAVLSLGLVFIILGIIPWQQLIASNTPVADIAGVLFNPLQSRLLSAGIFLALVGSAAGGAISSPRLILALARDKLFIEQFSEIHPKYRTPHKAIVFQTVFSIFVVLISFGRYKTLLSMLVPLALIMYIAVLMCIPILRKKKPGLARYFKVPFARVGPVLVSAIYLSVIVAWFILEKGAPRLFSILIIFVLFSIPIYLLLNTYYNPDFIISVYDWSSKMNQAMENLIMPKRIKKEIFSTFSDYKDCTVLEFGAGIGTLTMHLADLVGPNGKVYATDLSINNLDILRKRLEIKGHKHVELIHDRHQINRVHPDVKKVDMIFSLGTLSYIQDIKKVLKEMHGILQENGRICFIEYVDYFWGMIPSRSWLSRKDLIEAIFHECGFSITIRKKKGLFWNYLFIVGIKSREGVPFI